MYAIHRSCLCGVGAALGGLLLATLPMPASCAAETQTDTAHIERLVRRLGSPSYAERLKAQTQLKAFGTAAAPVLQEALTSSDPEIAAQAAELLEYFKSRQAPVRYGFDSATAKLAEAALIAAPNDALWKRLAEMLGRFRDVAGSRSLTSEGRSLLLHWAARMLDRGAAEEGFHAALLRVARRASGTRAEQAVAKHLWPGLLQRLKGPTPSAGLLPVLQSVTAARLIGQKDVQALAALVTRHTTDRRVPDGHPLVIRPVTVLALLQHGDLAEGQVDGLLGAALKRWGGKPRAPSPDALRVLSYLATSPGARPESLGPLIVQLTAWLGKGGPRAAATETLLKTLTGRQVTGTTAAERARAWREWWERARWRGVWKLPRSKRLYAVLISCLQTAPAPARATYVAGYCQTEKRAIGFHNPDTGGWMWFCLAEPIRAARRWSIGVDVVDWGWYADAPPQFYESSSRLRLDRFYASRWRSGSRRGLTLLRITRAPADAGAGKIIVGNLSVDTWVDHLILAARQAEGDDAREIMAALAELPTTRGRRVLVQLMRESEATLALPAAEALFAKDDPVGRAHLLALAEGAAVPVACQAARTMARLGDAAGADALIRRRIAPGDRKSLLDCLEAIAEMEALSAKARRALGRQLGRRCLVGEKADRLSLEQVIPLLRDLSGQDFGWRPGAPAEARRRAIAKWRHWIMQRSLDDLTP